MYVYNLHAFEHQLVLYQQVVNQPLYMQLYIYVQI